MTIPRIIHQIWYQGTDNIPPKYRANASALRRLNPGWQHVVWDDAGLQQLCAAAGCLETYLGYKILHQRIDFGRYVALYTHGGISVDMDVRPLRSFDELPFLDSDHLIVSEIVIDALQERATGKLVNNATMLCRPRDPAMHYLLHRIQQKQIPAWLPEFVQVLYTTGPMAVTGVLRQCPHPVRIVDAVYFEPCHGINARCRPKPESFLYHQHDGTWHGLHDLFALYYAAKRLFSLEDVVIVLSLIVIVIAFILYGRRRGR
jgi:mannosyltransferase OCH1-like enzyme